MMVSQAPAGSVKEYLPIPVDDGLETSVLGLELIVRRDHFVGPENRELLIACTATMATAYYRFAETKYLDDSQAAMVRGNAAGQSLLFHFHSPLIHLFSLLLLGTVAGMLNYQ